MKKLKILFLMLFAPGIVIAQYKPAEQGSTLTFVIKNLGFGVNGSFKGFDGSINFDPQNLTSSSFDVTVNAATVNTGNDLRDEHLRGDSFFDVKNYPKIRLMSTKVIGKNGSYVFAGQLTIKGKTTPVSFPFTAMTQPDGYLFKGSFKLNRKDYGVGGTSTVSNDVEVTLNVISKK